MPKPKTSVFFVNSDSRHVKKVQIPTKLLLHWKKYLIICSCAFIAVGFALGFLIYKKTSNYFTTLYKKQINYAHKIEKAIDLEKVKASFESIDQRMAQINHFMEERGLSAMQMEENVGGSLDFDITDINDIAVDYVEKIKKTENNIRKIPMGWPLIGAVTSGYGYRKDPFGGKFHFMHTGVDIRGQQGTPVKATADGTIIFTGRKGGYGKCIIIQHDNKIKTLYGHLSEIDVQKGQPVEVGHIIGKVGSTGRSTGPHLHYEVIVQNKKINPRQFLDVL